MLQVVSHKGRGEGKNHLPQPAGHLGPLLTMNTKRVGQNVSCIAQVFFIALSQGNVVLML